jgi:hypothetical protein
MKRGTSLFLAVLAVGGMSAISTKAYSVPLPAEVKPIEVKPAELRPLVDAAVGSANPEGAGWRINLNDAQVDAAYKVWASDQANWMADSKGYKIPPNRRAFVELIKAETSGKLTKAFPTGWAGGVDAKAARPNVTVIISTKPLRIRIRLEW